ncbi:MAG: hypothetical protein MJ211_00610 [Bacteroidales bacterium]|nr:hypothetical protein [Bacteroidales bacterium]
MKLIKAILFILLLITFGCNDKKVSSPNSIYVNNKNMINSNRNHYSCSYVNNMCVILDYNYYLGINSYELEFYFTYHDTIGYSYFDYDENKEIYVCEDYSKGYVIQIYETSYKLFAKKLEEYLNNTLYYKQDKFELKKLITIKKILKEYFYASNKQNDYIPLKKYHKGFILKEEFMNNNSLIWNFENIYTNDKYKIELFVNNNLYNIKINKL